MKRSSWFVFCLSILSLAALTGCNSTLVNDSTPYISRSIMILNPQLSGDTIIGGKDTLDMNMLESSTNLYEIEPIHVGDSVVMAVVFGARTNQLLTASVTSGDTSVLRMDCRLNEALEKMLVSPSDIRKGQFYFSAGWSLIGFPVYYYARKAGSTTITLHVTSDSQYSPTTVYMRQTVTE